MSYIMTWFCFVLWTSLSLAFPIIHMLPANGRGRANTKTEDHIYHPVQRGYFWLVLLLFLFFNIVKTYHRVMQLKLQTVKEWK